MAAAGGGVIINVSTHRIAAAAPVLFALCRGEAGLNALTEGLAKAYGPLVWVTP